jgi:hypothetical protein
LELVRSNHASRIIKINSVLLTFSFLFFAIFSQQGDKEKNKKGKHNQQIILLKLFCPELWHWLFIDDDGPNGEFFSAIFHNLDEDRFKKFLK